MATIFVVPKAVLLAGTVLAMLGVYAGSGALLGWGAGLVVVSMLMWAYENERRHPAGRLGT